MSENPKSDKLRFLTEEQIETFRRDGVLVIPNVLTQDEVEQVKQEFHKTLKNYYGIDSDNLNNAQAELNAVKNAGIVNVFYQSWKMKLNTHPNFLNAMKDLYGSTYAVAEEKTDPFYSPFAPFQGDKLLFYIDRANYRVPTTQLTSSGLAVHVDCDPKFLYDMYPKTEDDLKNATECMHAMVKEAVTDLKILKTTKLTSKWRYKWRPVQSFIALTDNPSGDLGGFRALRGFHTKLHEIDFPYSKPNEEFTFLEPRGITSNKLEDIIYSAGDLVVWDWKIPHQNSMKHNGTAPREVIYTQVVPDVPLNRNYVNGTYRLWENDVMPFDFLPDEGMVFGREALLAEDKYVPDELGLEMFAQSEKK